MVASLSLSITPKTLHFPWWKPLQNCYICSNSPIRMMSSVSRTSWRGTSACNGCSSGTAPAPLTKDNWIISVNSTRRSFRVSIRYISISWKAILIIADSDKILSSASLMRRCGSMACWRSSFLASTLASHETTSLATAKASIPSLILALGRGSTSGNSRAWRRSKWNHFLTCWSGLTVSQNVLLSRPVLARSIRLSR